MTKKIFVIFLVFLTFFVLVYWNLTTSPTPKRIFSPFIAFLPSSPSSIIPEPIYEPKTPTLEKIFSPDHTGVKSLPSEKVRILIATGDVIPARAVNFQVVKLNNFLWPWEKTADVLRAGDVTLINLEAPVLKNCQPTTQGMVFCGDPRHIEGLKFASVDVANLANNHLGNSGSQGAEETVELLKTNEIEACGVGEWALKNVRGLRFAFLGYNDVGASLTPISPAEEKLIAEQTRAAREQAEVIVVSFHWGNEYVTQPTARQRNLAHLAIDSGADLIVGNHPHWIQPVEIYKEKLITYAHGNFIFDQTWSEETKKGIIGKYTFYENKLIDAEFLPIYIAGFGQPQLLEGESKQSILKSLEKSSHELEGTPVQ